VLKFRIVRRRVTLKGRAAHYREHKERARELAHVRASHFAAAYGVQYIRIAIRNQKSRWGSCSEKGNLNFHYKIALLPPHLVDYVVVHEVCHLREFNHSRAFWDLVAQNVPAHVAARRELRQIEKSVRG
jgi:predicted metal-dependent hydrolase